MKKTTDAEKQILLAMAIRDARLIVRGIPVWRPSGNERIVYADKLEYGSRRGKEEAQRADS